MATDMKEKRVLITSGPTRARLDAVRFLSNRSSGRLGCRIAIEALRSGSYVTLVAGPDSVIPQKSDLSEAECNRLRVEPIDTVEDLLQVLEAECTGAPRYDVVIHAMAVLDYVPEEPSKTKVPSGREEWTLRLKPTPKVIRKIKEWLPDVFLVGFKLEVGTAEAELLAAGRESLRKNRADLVVANDLTQIRDESHPALIIDPGGEIRARPGTKSEIARSLCELLSERPGD